MKLKRPSPAMTVAVVALVMSMTGGAIAAVNFAENAGSVDGYSAVKASKGGKAKAAGKLVATYKRGDNRGRLPLRIIAGAASQNSVEDLALPFFCVSANLSSGKATVHREGRLWQWLRASVAIPGVLPPVFHGGHSDAPQFSRRITRMTSVNCA